MDPGSKAARRYANQVLALHQALALLRMHLIDPALAPDAVEKAAVILEQATEPLRQMPARQLQAPMSPGQRERAIRRRLDAGMSAQAAELTLEWGVRIGPDGQDLNHPDP